MLKIFALINSTLTEIKKISIYKKVSLEVEAPHFISFISILIDTGGHLHI